MALWHKTGTLELACSRIKVRRDWMEPAVFLRCTFNRHNEGQCLAAGLAFNDRFRQFMLPLTPPLSSAGDVAECPPEGADPFQRLQAIASLGSRALPGVRSTQVRAKKESNNGSIKGYPALNRQFGWNFPPDPSFNATGPPCDVSAPILLCFCQPAGGQCDRHCRKRYFISRARPQADRRVSEFR